MTPTRAVPASGGRNFRELLKELVKRDDVRGGLIIASDGLLIAAEVPRDVSVESLAALAATLGRELEVGGPRLRRGTFVMAHFAATDGMIFLGGTPVGFIVLLTERNANADAIRQTLREAMDSIQLAWSPHKRRH